MILWNSTASSSSSSDKQSKASRRNGCGFVGFVKIQIAIAAEDAAFCRRIRRTILLLRFSPRQKAVQSSVFSYINLSEKGL